MFLISYAKLAPEWELIRENFDLIQEIEPKVGDGYSFKGGCFFARLWYLTICGVGTLSRVGALSQDYGI